MEDLLRLSALVFKVEHRRRIWRQIAAIGIRHSVFIFDNIDASSVQTVSRKVHSSLYLAYVGLFISRTKLVGEDNYYDTGENLPSGF